MQIYKEGISSKLCVNNLSFRGDFRGLMQWTLTNSVGLCFGGGATCFGLQTDVYWFVLTFHLSSRSSLRSEGMGGVTLDGA